MKKKMLLYRITLFGCLLLNLGAGLVGYFGFHRNPFVFVVLMMMLEIIIYLIARFIYNRVARR